MSHVFEWTQDGVNNGEPVWVLKYGDYGAIVMKGYPIKDETNTWSFRVNNNGRMNLSSAEEGKALAEGIIGAGIVARVAAARRAITQYDAEYVLAFANTPDEFKVHPQD